MTEYYRVRTPEQWFWLMKRIESDNRKARFYGPLFPPCRPTKLEMHPEDFKKDVLVGVNGNEVEWDTFNYFVKEENVTEFIEVSDLMEGEKMENEDYVTLKGEDLLKIKNEDNRKSFTYTDGLFDTANYFKELRIPKSLLYPKVRMSVAEKKEFDELKKEVDHASEALSTVRITDFGESDLARKIYRKHELSELDFARAWADPSIIEVVKEKKFNVKVPVSKGRDYYEKYSTVKEDNLVIVGTLNSLRELSTNTEFQFTEAELKQHGLDSDMYEKVEVKE